MGRQSIPTNRRLWLGFAVGLLVTFGCVNWVPESKALAYWPTWVVFLTGNYGMNTGEFLFVLGMWGAMLLLPAVVLGWLGQALVQVFRYKFVLSGE